MIEVEARRSLGQFSLAACVSDGGFICLTGRNGSGKSCLLKAIAGLLPMDGGHVRINGLDVTGFPVEARGVVMVTPSSLLPHMRVDSHLIWGSRLKNLSVPRERLSSVKKALGIDFDGRVAELSLGMREKVSLATALLSNPKVILVDEAFSNIHQRWDFMSAYRKLVSEAGIDVIFSTQDSSEGAGFDHLYLMSDGATERIS